MRHTTAAGELLVCGCRANKGAIRSNGEAYVELPIKQRPGRLFFHLAGNRTSFSAKDSEETGGNGLLLCLLPDGNKETKCQIK